MAMELATAYVSILPDTSQVGRGIDRALRGAGSSADRAGADIGTRMSNALGKTLKVGAAAAAATAGAGIATALTKGWQRLSAIDDAEGKLIALGNTSQQTAKIMDSAMASVKGTSYGFGDAAGMAATATAAGVEPGKELTRYLSLVADAATIANVPLAEMGQIFGKVQTSQRAYTMEITQLADRGIPIWQWLQKEMGATQEELRDLVADGKVTSEDYLNAIEKNIGGAATAATTVSSQWANTMAAVGRLGAAALEPTFGRLAGWMGSGISSIDEMTDAVGPLAEALDSKIFEEWGPKLAEAFEALRNSDLGEESLNRVREIFSDLSDTAQELWPSIRTIAESLAEASAATGVSVWRILLTTLESVAPILEATLVPALAAIASLMEDNQGAVTALMIAFAAFRTLPAIGALAARAFTPLRTAMGSTATATAGVRAGFAAMRGDFRNLAPQIGRTSAAMRAMGQNSATIRNMQNALLGSSSAAGGLAGAVRAGLTPALSGLRSAASNTVAAMGGLAGIGVTAALIAIPQLIGAAQNWDRQAEITENSADDVAEAQRRMGEAFEESAGKVDDAVFAEVTKQAELFTGELESLSKSGPGFWDGFIAAGKDVAAVFQGEWWSGTEAYDSQERLAEQAKRTLDALNDLGIGSTELARAIAGGQGSWDAFVERLRSSGEVSDEVIGHVQGLRDEFVAQREAAKNLSPGIMDLSEHFTTLADTASTAEEKSNALKQTLDILAGGVPELNDAMQDYNELVRDIGDSTSETWDQSKGWAEDLIGEGGVNTATENGGKLRESILDIRDATADVVAAGGDLDAALASNVEMFENLSRATGVPIDELMRLAELEGYKPEVFELTMRLQGAEDVESQLAAIGSYVDTFPDKPLVLNTEGLEGAIDQLREYGFEVEDIGNGQVKINIDNAEANAELDEFLARLGIVNDAEAEPTVDLNSEMLVAKADQADDLIAYLHTQEATPAADLIISKLQEGKEISVQELVDLSSKVADPEVILNIAKAMADKEAVDKELDRIAQKQRIAEIQVRIAANAPIHSIDAWANAFGGQVIRNADGGIHNLPEQARIEPGRGQGLYQWAEGETGGEAFIPLAQSKRGRSTQILGEVANRFGLKIQKFADGGITRALGAARSVTGNTYDWGGIGPTNFDCSGFVGWIQQILMGMNAAEAAGRRLYTTYSLLGGSTAGLQSGMGPAGTAFVVGVNQEHMAATLAGNNLEAGGSHGTSSLNGPAVGAFDSQFSNLYHLPNGSIDGGVDGSSSFSYSQPVEWTEKDEIDLESARVAVIQAQEARDKTYANEKKSDADRQQADIKVQRAELKVRELENKRDGKGEAEIIVTPAPELEGEMDEDMVSIRRAEIAVMDAQLARDKVYSDPESTSLEKEKADIAVFDARNSLETTKERIAEDSEDGADNKDGWSTETVRDRVAKYGADVAGILFDSALEIFGIESRWLDIPWPKYELESEKKKKSKTGKSEGGDEKKPSDELDIPISGFPGVDDQLGFDPKQGVPEWFAEHLKKTPLKVFDDGGWLKPGEMGINLSTKPEPIFNSPDQLREFAGASLDTLEPASAQGGNDYSVKIVNPTFANESKMMRAARDRQEMSMMRHGRGGIF